VLSVAIALFAIVLVSFSSVSQPAWAVPTSAKLSPSHCLLNAFLPDAMTPQAIQAAIAQARQAWITGDAEAFSALFTANGELIVPGQRWQGRDAIRHVLSEFAATHTNVEIEIQRIMIDSHQATVEWTWQDTEIATGKRSQAEDAIVVDFVEGQISRWREYIDTKTPKQNAMNGDRND
jgi:uncharacterized protein (TIGR02246 family)